MRIDVHQHLWTSSLIDELASRESLPFVRVDAGLTVLHSAGEPPYLIDVEAEAPERRRGLLSADGVDLALIALSSPIGIEALPRPAAMRLIEAHLDGVGTLGDGFAVWGPLALDHPEPDDVDALLDRGCVGVSIPAAALDGPDPIRALGPVLARVAEHQVPLFVHPGRAPGQPVHEPSLTEPLWWQALTGYVAQMQAAWLAFMAFGRREHPELKILFAMLAGGAPLLSERLTARGGPSVELGDPTIFYETSGYGPAAVEATAGRVGQEQLVYGSDRPVMEPVSTGLEPTLQDNGVRLLAPAWVPAPAGVPA